MTSHRRRTFLSAVGSASALALAGCMGDDEPTQTADGGGGETLDTHPAAVDADERRRGKLQQTGTRSAHLTIQSIGDRFANWGEDYLHRVSKEVVAEAVANGCDTIVLEKLKGIRERMSNLSKFQQWAFKQLSRKITYKAKAEGTTVEVVNPAYTSQQCIHAECGFTHKKNRDGDGFVCQKCDKELHSDYNAARNIAMRYLRNRHKSGSGGPTNHLALKSGTMNGSGDFTPTALSG